MREVTKKLFGRVSNMKFSLSDFVFLVMLTQYNSMNKISFYS